MPLKANANDEDTHTIATTQKATVDASPLEEVVIPQYRAVTVSNAEKYLIESKANDGTIENSVDLKLTGLDIIRRDKYIEDETWIDDQDSYFLQTIDYLEYNGHKYYPIGNKDYGDWRTYTFRLSPGKILYFHAERTMTRETRWNGRLYDPSGHLEGSTHNIKVRGKLTENGISVVNKQLNFHHRDYHKLPYLKVLDQPTGTNVTFDQIIPKVWSRKNITEIKNITLTGRMRPHYHHGLTNKDLRDSVVRIQSLSPAGWTKEIDVLRRGIRPVITMGNIEEDPANRGELLPIRISSSQRLITGVTITKHNLPTGLTPTLSFDWRSPTLGSGEIKFTGKAANHDDLNDLTNVSFEFRGYFYGRPTHRPSDPSVVVDNVSLDYIDDADFELTPFVESATDDGAVDSTTLTLKNGEIGTITTITATNLPTGITGANYTKTNASQIELTLQGNASAHDADIDNITFTIDANLSEGGGFNKLLHNPHSIKNTSINFFTQPTMRIVPTVFSETQDKNDGSIQSKVIFDLGDTYQIESTTYDDIDIRENTDVSFNIKGTGRQNINIPSNPPDTITQTLTTPTGESYKITLDKTDPAAATKRSYRIIGGLGIARDARIRVGGNTIDFPTIPASTREVRTITDGRGNNYDVEFKRRSGTTNVYDVNIIADKKFPHTTMNILYYNGSVNRNYARSIPQFNIWDITIERTDAPFDGGSLEIRHKNIKNRNTTSNKTLPSSSLGITSSNLPTGLSIKPKLLPPSQLEVTLTGNATNHRNSDDMTDLSFEVTGPFSNPQNLGPKPITDATLDFFDEIEAVFVGSNIFSEHIIQDFDVSKPLDVGAIREKKTITFTRTGQTPELKRSVDDHHLNINDPVSPENNTIISTNLPTGLAFRFSKIDPANFTQVEVEITGVASQHDEGDELNLSFDFNPKLFVTEHIARARGSIDFDDRLGVVIDRTNNEIAEVRDDGSVVDGELDPTDEILIRLENGRLTSSTGGALPTNADIASSIQITQNGTPVTIGTGATTDILQGLRVSYAAVNDTTISVKLKGLAVAHANADDVDNLQFTLANHDIIATRTGRRYTPDYIGSASVNFIDMPFVRISSDNIFLEDGSTYRGNIENAITITGNIPWNDALKTSAQMSPFIHITPSVPDGLTPFYEKIDAHNLRVSFKGRALSHQNINDRDIVFRVDGEMMQNRVSPIDRLSASINFIDEPIITSKNHTFLEAIANNGSVRNPITLQIEQDTFSNISSADIKSRSLISIPNLPNLDPTYTVSPDGQFLTIDFGGQAVEHKIEHSTDFDIVISNELLHYDRSDATFSAQINFLEAPAVSVSPHFEESRDNDGKIRNTAIISVSKDTFDIKRPFKFATTLFTIDSQELQELNIGGVDLIKYNASTPANIDVDEVVRQIGYYTNGVRVETDKGAFANVFAEKDNGKVILYSDDIATDDSISVSYRFKGFNYKNPQSKKDDPRVNHQTNSGTIEIDQIRNYIGIRNLPLGLDATYKYLNPSEIEVELLGVANPHANANDVDSLEFDLQPPLFASKVAVATTPTNSINFIDTPTLSISNNTFSEVNTGTNFNQGLLQRQYVDGTGTRRDFHLNISGDQLHLLDNAGNPITAPTHNDIAPIYTGGECTFGIATAIYFCQSNDHRRSLYGSSETTR